MHKKGSAGYFPSKNRCHEKGRFISGAPVTVATDLCLYSTTAEPLVPRLLYFLVPPSFPTIMGSNMHAVAFYAPVGLDSLEPFRARLLTHHAKSLGGMRTTALCIVALGAWSRAPAKRLFWCCSLYRGGHRGGSDR